MNKTNNKYIHLFSNVIMIIISLFFIILPFRNIILKTFLWHVKQPSVIQGLIEIFLYFIILVLSILFVKNIRFIIFSICLLVCYYLQAHQALFAILFAWIYFEIIISIGNIFNIIIYKRDTNTLENYLINFLIGFIIWSTIAILCSLLNIGSISVLRIITIILGLFSLIFNVRIKKHNYLFLKLVNSFILLNKKQKILSICIIFLILIQCVKGTHVADYDSLWYGLFTDRYLFSENSFYESYGLYQFVNYYNKLFELFSAPFTGFNIPSLIYSVNIMFYFLILCVCYKIISFFNINITNTLLLIIAIGTVACLSNMASTAKTDVSTVFFLLLVVLLYFKFIFEKDINNLIFAVIACFPVLCLKVHGVFYLFSIFIGCILVSYYYKIKNKKSLLINKNKYLNKNLLLLGLAIFVLLGIHYRTYKLTGYPTYPFLLNIWKMIGLKGVYPFRDPNVIISAVNENKDLLFIIKHIYNMLFYPSAIREYQNSQFDSVWPGNIFVWLGLIISIILISKLIFKNKYKYNISLSIEIKCLLVFFIPLLIECILYSTIWYNLARDGNYFIFPVCISIIVFGVILMYILNNINIDIYKLKMHINIILSILLLLQFMIMFVSHWSWLMGTDIIRINILKPIFKNKYEYNNNYELNFEVLNLMDIENYFKNNELNNPRVIGNIHNQTMKILSCRYEDLSRINEINNVFNNRENIINYLNWAKIDFIIISKNIKDTKNETTLFLNTVQHLLNNGSAVLVKNFKNCELILYNLNIILENEIIDKAIYKGFYDDNWINGNANILKKDKKSTKFCLNGFQPDNFPINNITVTINNNESITIDMIPGKEFIIELDFINNLDYINIDIVTEKTFIPKNEGWNNDIRELGALIISWLLI